MKKHFDYFDFEPTEILLLRREAVRHAATETLAAGAAGAAIIGIGMKYNIRFTEIALHNILNLSYIVFLFSLACVGLLFVTKLLTAVRALTLKKKDVMNTIRQLAPEDFYIMRTKGGGLIVQTSQVSDDDKKQTLYILKKMERKYPHLAPDFLESLKKMIKAHDPVYSAEGVIRAEVIYEQLSFGNEKIIDSIEENYRSPKGRACL